jgi:hypothetical protein
MISCSSVERMAEPLSPLDRAAFLRRVAELLDGIEIGDGSVARAARTAQSELWRAPDLSRASGTSKRR